MRPTLLRRVASASTTRRMAVVLAGLAWSGAAMAAPFCLRNQSMMEPLCIYYDANSCQQESVKQGGDCSINREEVKVRGGFGQYCLVTSSMAVQCFYPDRESCMADARRQNAACTESSTPAASATPDPYSRQAGY
jgi:hypothetical protein